MATCPRRMNEMGPWEREEGLDSWWTDRGGLVGQPEIGESCSFCGSLHPDRFMELVREGWAITPTDKSYKAYLRKAVPGGPEAKFYYQHLSREQQIEFIELHNNRRMRIAEPGHFYVLPFFVSRTPAMP